MRTEVVLTKGVQAKLLSAKESDLLVLQGDLDPAEYPNLWDTLLAIQSLHPVSVIWLPDDMHMDSLSTEQVATLDQLAERVHEQWRQAKIAEGYPDHSYRPTEIMSLSLMPDGTMDPTIRGGCCGRDPAYHRAGMEPWTQVSDRTKQTRRDWVRWTLEALRRKETDDDAE